MCVCLGLAIVGGFTKLFERDLQEAAGLATHDGVVQLLPNFQVLLAAHANDLFCFWLERALWEELLGSLGNIADAFCIYTLRCHVVHIPVEQQRRDSPKPSSVNMMNILLVTAMVAVWWPVQNWVTADE